MRYISTLLVITLSILFSYNSQAQANVNPHYIYTIHLGAFDKAELTDFDDIRFLGYIYAYPLRDDLKQIFMGGYGSKSAARKILDKIKSSGYPDAYIMRKAYDEGEAVIAVQLTTERVGSELDYGKYLQAGHIYVAQMNAEIQVFGGQFSNTSTAQRRANQLRRIGFVDAEVVEINMVQLIEVTDFETGGAAANDVVVRVDTPKGKSEEEEALPDSYDVLFKKSTLQAKGATKTKIPDDVPTSYGDEAGARIEIPVKKETKVELPNIRVRVKRTSALELQKVLKAEGTYKNSLDGYYGIGTEKGYADIKKKNQQVRKYLMLSKMMGDDELDSSNRLQKIINNILDNPSDANELLQAERSPLAKVYRAYILLQARGENDAVNRLMNEAIQETFRGKKLKNTPPFDYTSKYAYADLTQLLKHANYIHAATDDAEVPCWIFSQHSEEAAKAFATGNGSTRMASCGGDFMSWEETKLLKTIAADLDPNFGKDQKQQAKYAMRRNLLFNMPKKMTASEAKEVMAWHSSLWSAMQSWANSDPIHDQRVTALKVAYFQSQVRLEDYFMNKGFTYKESKPLAMYVLQTIVGTHFVKYLGR
ncbi:MAG: SPOR domain-containing protein [Bacteroidota bacterium]